MKLVGASTGSCVTGVCLQVFLIRLSLLRAVLLPELRALRRSDEVYRAVLCYCSVTIAALGVANLTESSTGVVTNLTTTSRTGRERKGSSNREHKEGGEYEDLHDFSNDWVCFPRRLRSNKYP